MVGKIIKIGLLVVLGVVCFGASFFISGKMKSSSTEETILVVKEAEPERFDLEKELLGGLASMKSAELNPKEKQLDELIQEVRAKLKKLERRERDIVEREKRLSMATEYLKKQSNDIGELRTELFAAIIPLKAAKKNLLRSKALIKTQEISNLQKTAKMYAKMEAANAAKVILEMYNAKQGQQAAKIIYFMSDKSWAAIMDEIKESGKAVEIINKQLQVITDPEDGKS